MRQSKYLFIGGPWDGQWREIPPGLPMWVVPEIHEDWLGLRSPAEEMRLHNYYPRRVLIPGWFVPLTIYTTDPSRQAPHGTALPGLIQGEFPQWSGVTGLDTHRECMEALHVAIRERRYRP